MENRSSSDKCQYFNKKIHINYIESSKIDFKILLILKNQASPRNIKF